MASEQSESRSDVLATVPEEEEETSSRGRSHRTSAADSSSEVDEVEYPFPHYSTRRTRINVGLWLERDGAPPRMMTYGSLHDLSIRVDVTIPPGHVVSMPTGVGIRMPGGYWGDIRSRSSWSILTPTIVVTGTIDDDYTGEIFIVMRNVSRTLTVRVRKGERIAQLAFHRKIYPIFYMLGGGEPVRVRPPQPRTGGFGSTGMYSNEGFHTGRNSNH